MLGLTIATLLGAPLATWAGQLLGWRAGVCADRGDRPCQAWRWTASSFLYVRPIATPDRCANSARC